MLWLMRRLEVLEGSKALNIILKHSTDLRKLFSEDPGHELVAMAWGQGVLRGRMNPRMSPVRADP